MRSILIALAIGLFATAARADGVQMVLCYTSSVGEVKECPTNLVKGQDYEIIVDDYDDNGTIELVNPAGITTISMPSGYNPA